MKIISLLSQIMTRQNELALLHLAHEDLGLTDQIVLCDFHVSIAHGLFIVWQ